MSSLAWLPNKDSLASRAKLGSQWAARTATGWEAMTKMIMWTGDLTLQIDLDFWVDLGIYAAFAPRTPLLGPSSTRYQTRGLHESRSAPLGDLKI